jgi:hypothetical protein
MNQMRSTADAGAPAATGAGFDLRVALLGVGGLSFLLGAAIELLLFAVDPAQTSVPDLVNSLVRSFVICMGLALALATWGSRAAMTGLAGLLAAPVAIYAARFLQDATAQALAIAGSPPAGPLSPTLLAVLKGIEYGCIGLGIGWLQQRSREGPLAFCLVGLVAGIVFGGVILLLTSRGSVSAATLIPWGINELLFPVGCTLVVSSGKALGRRPQQ